MTEGVGPRESSSSLSCGPDFEWVLASELVAITGASSKRIDNYMCGQGSGGKGKPVLQGAGEGRPREEVGEVARGHADKDERGRNYYCTRAASGKRQ